MEAPAPPAYIADVASLLVNAFLYAVLALFMLAATVLALVIWDGLTGLLVPGFLDWPEKSGFIAFHHHYFPSRETRQQTPEHA